MECTNGAGLKPGATTYGMGLHLQISGEELVGQAAHFFDEVSDRMTAEADDGEESGEGSDAQERVEGGEMVVVADEQCQCSSEHSDQGQELAHKQPRMKLRTKSLRISRTYCK